MKRITTIIVALCAAITIAAQTATEKVQQREKGKGSVTVTQSSTINDLINNKGGQQSKSATPSTNGNSSQQVVSTPDGSGSIGDGGSTVSSSPEDMGAFEGEELDEIYGETGESHSKPRATTTKKKPVPEGELDAEKLKVREDYDFKSAESIKGPKIVRGEHKARGWRILVFTGGNKRIDREGAQAAGNKVKKNFPGLPVYTHFYTPRWMTYCGNFHDHKEAESVKKELVKKGFKSASIVRTQITVE